MLFMVVEKFRSGEAKPVYRRFSEDAGFNRCFQLMECEDACLLQEWILHWQDLVEFEVFPVVESKTAAETVKKVL